MIEIPQVSTEAKIARLAYMYSCLNISMQKTNLTIPQIKNITGPAFAVKLPVDTGKLPNEVNDFLGLGKIRKPEKDILVIQSGEDPVFGSMLALRLYNIQKGRIIHRKTVEAQVREHHPTNVWVNFSRKINERKDPEWGRDKHLEIALAIFNFSDNMFNNQMSTQGVTITYNTD
jgi:hypothetical protein